MGLPVLLRSRRNQSPGRYRNVPLANQMYEVQILYREPLYETWTGTGARLPFVARYRGITAPSRDQAAKIAEERFFDLARDSRVKWRREVVEVRVEPVD